jgi:uncharacterized membrane protein YhhN
VNIATATAFGIAAVFAIGNWIAVAYGHRALEYVCKPATLTALIAAALLLDPAAGADTRRAWFVFALLCSLAGDVFLMLDDIADLFVAGLAAFLVAHLCYSAGFLTASPSPPAVLLALVLVAIVVTPIARRVLQAVTEHEPALHLPVTGYIVVISAMLVLALATGNVIAAIGAALFVASDSMIAWNRFVRAFPAAGVAIMVTYHLGQAGLVLSLLR